jgi:hypothetical protein
VNTWKVILASLVIFGAGAITGGLLTTYSKCVAPPSDKGVATDSPRRAPGLSASGTNRDHRLPPPLIVPLRKDYLEKLNRELKLTPEQRDRIERIIREGQERTKALWEQIEPDLYEELVDTKDKIRVELAPEQKTRFEELLRKRPAQPKPHPSTNSPSPATVTNSLPAAALTNPPPANP